VIEEPMVIALSTRVVGLAAALAAQDPTQDPFGTDVRPTPWLSPEDERKALHVPDGFEIVCFAHEPDLFKPMNLAFDARGRLWCTSSTEYPYPVKGDKEFKGRDRITVHEDTDGDGVADRTTVFADDLDVPIGIYPCVDPEGHDGAIVFSIPNIWRLDDLDGDGRADRREVLYGPFGWERDTHGLNNSFRRGFDGWIYANHGYNNVTTVKGADGHEVHMESGNTYRFRIDGSRIEQFTYGQVNPFGSCFDERGDLYTADCHTLPITLLIRGGHYESFGKPHDGVGFTPQIMKHLHGSTALCGLAITTGDRFPAEYRDDLFVGNVMTCRVHRDQLVFDGSTPRAIEQDDFVKSDDPWFRPVDLQFGLDGALYVADFYNRIIGHYEVPLDHPGRDRTSGRIWRIAWVGKDAATHAKAYEKAPDLRKADARALVERFDDPNLVVRMRALDELTDRLHADETSVALLPPPSKREPNSPPEAFRRDALLAWARYRLGRTDWSELLSQPGLPRLHLLKALAELHYKVTPPEDPTGFRGPEQRYVLSALDDVDPFVRRAAVDALGQHPSLTNLAALLHLFVTCPQNDAILRHSIKIALRNQLEIPHALEVADNIGGDAATEQLLLDLCLALKGEEVGRFVIDHLREDAAGEARSIGLLEHAAREAAPADLPKLVERVRRRFSEDRPVQFRMLEAILAGLDARGLAAPPSLAAWSDELVSAVLASPEALAPAWRDSPVAGVGKSANPWDFKTRRCADGVEATLLDSLPRGETLTGTIRSPAFELPPKLALFVAGHNGEPDRAEIPFNKVRVRDAESGALLAEAKPPRNDVAQRVELDLSAAPGRRGVLEVVDGNPYDAYAWIAVGRFEPAVVALPGRAPADVAGELLASCRLARRYGSGRASAPVAERLAALARGRDVEPAVRAAAASALDPAPLASALAALVDDPDAPAELIDPICEAIAAPATSDGNGARREAALLELAAKGVEICPGRQQPPLAAALARTKEGALRLLDLVAKGKAPARLLSKENVRAAVVAALPASDAEPKEIGGEARIAALTKSLPSEDAARAKLIADRRKGFSRYGGDAELGAPLFTKSCASCHQFLGKGAVVGPQLDGVASRGFERLLEDILDPNRNVDVQFQRTNLYLADGDILSVLIRRTEGATLVYCDDTGKEMRIQLADVSKQRPSPISLMPDNFGDAISEQDLRDLLAYLIAKR
jgi:putative heme-binding domain-containing protein